MDAVTTIRIVGKILKHIHIAAQIEDAFGKIVRMISTAIMEWSTIEEFQIISSVTRITDQIEYNFCLLCQFFLDAWTHIVSEEKNVWAIGIVLVICQTVIWRKENAQNMSVNTTMTAR